MRHLIIYKYIYIYIMDDSDSYVDFNLRNIDNVQNNEKRHIMYHT